MVSCSSAGDDGGVVELVLGEDRGDFERMGEIGVAGGALLLAMRLHGIDIGAVEQVLVGMRVVASDAFDELVLPHQSALRAAAAAQATGTMLGASRAGARRAFDCDSMRGKSLRGTSARVNSFGGKSLDDGAIAFPAQRSRRGLRASLCKISWHRGRAASANARRPTPLPAKLPQNAGACRRNLQDNKGRAKRPPRCDEKPGDDARDSRYSSSSASWARGRSSGGAKPFEALEQFLFGHAVDSDLGVVGLDAAAADQRHRLGLGLVDLDVFLQGMDKVFLQIPGRNGRVGDFAQRHHRVFVVVAIDGDLGTRMTPSGRDGWPSRTRSNRFSTLSMQSSTVTRAMDAPCGCCCLAEW